MYFRFFIIIFIFIIANRFHTKIYKKTLQARNPLALYSKLR